MNHRRQHCLVSYAALEKKLHVPPPKEPLPTNIETHRTTEKTRREPCDDASIERGVRQLLADKVSGNLVGVWLLVAEYLRLGLWELLCGWCGVPGSQVQPRLALQLVNEAALCVTGIREARSLSQKGFELANGLPFVATDQAIHTLLDGRTIEHSKRLQVALGKLRRASGHFKGALLAIDPHRVRSYSKRQMRLRQDLGESAPTKTSQTFFCLDVDTHQPLCMTTATNACSAAEAAPELLAMAGEILDPTGRPLVLADGEHVSASLFTSVAKSQRFHLLCPMARQRSLCKTIETLPAEQFTPHWAGFATMMRDYRFTHSHTDMHQIIQRCGEVPSDYHYKAFISTTDEAPLKALSENYPRRWHIEEFFNLDQALGWKRAGTLNLHIRYAQMTMALLAQAALHQLRQRLGPPLQSWDAAHMAGSLLAGLQGDIRVKGDTILVTYYNAPNAEALRRHYEGLPEKLQVDRVSPKIPWLYDYKLDFRFA